MNVSESWGGSVISDQGTSIFHSKLPLLVIVVPSFNEEEALPVFCETVLPILESISNTVIPRVLFVDDGSSDETLRFCRAKSQADERWNGRLLLES